MKLLNSLLIDIPLMLSPPVPTTHEELLVVKRDPDGPEGMMTEVGTFEKLLVPKGGAVWPLPGEPTVELGNVNGGYNVDKEPETEAVAPLKLALSVGEPLGILIVRLKGGKLPDPILCEVTPVEYPLAETVKLKVGNGGGNIDPVIIVVLALPLIDTVVGERDQETVEAVPVFEKRELYPAEPADAPDPVTVPLIMADEFPEGKGKGADCEAVPVLEVTPLDATLPEAEVVRLDEETVPGRAEVERVSPLDAATVPPVGNGSAVEFPSGYGGETKLEGGLDPITVPEEMATVRELEETVPKLEVTGTLPKPELLELPSGYDAEDEDGVVPDGGLTLGVPGRLTVDRDPDTVKTEKDPEANGAIEEPVGLADPVPFDIEYGAEPIEEDPAPLLEEPEEVAACADVPILDGIVVIPVNVPVILLNVSVCPGVAVLVVFALVDVVDLKDEFVKVRLPLAGMLLIARRDVEVIAAVAFLERDAINVELVPPAPAVPAPKVALATELVRVPVKFAVGFDAVPAGVDPGDSVPPVAIEVAATDPVDPAAVLLLGNGGRGTVPEKVSTDMVPPAPVTVDRDRLAACVAEDPNPEPVDAPDAIPGVELNPVNDVGYATELAPDWPEGDDPDTAAVLALPEAVPEEKPDAPPEELIPEAVEAPRLDPVPGPAEPLAGDEDRALPVTAAVWENPEITRLVWVTVVVLEYGIVKDPLSGLRVVAEEAPDDRLALEEKDPEAVLVDTEPALAAPDPVAAAEELEALDPVDREPVVEPEETELVPDPGTGPADAEPAAEPVETEPVELAPLVTDPNDEPVTGPADGEPGADAATEPVDEPTDEGAVPDPAPGAADAEPAVEPGDNDPVTQPVDDEPVTDPNAEFEIGPADAEPVAVEPGVS
ncbi:hypothetical protein DL767_000919 [Monosporascus sp. MG133]|nr:hypothetical protein DL767_000919 [Monosporascus sp. MG133]